MTVTAEGLTRRYGSVCAVDDVSVSVAPGEVLGIAGPSGCGKSTLLRLLGGLERPDAGTLRYGSEAVWAGRRARYPRPGYVMAVFQDPAASLDARWPVWRSVTEPLTVHRRLSKAERVEIARDCLGRAGIDRIDARPGELSGGQCQRVALVRALIAEPSLLIADEPTARQDVVTAAALTGLMRELLPPATAMVVVSHDRRWLGTLADDVLQFPTRLQHVGVERRDGYPI